MKMKAKKSFLFNGSLVKQGDTFTTTEAKSFEYERNNLAEKVEDTKVIAPYETQSFSVESTNTIQPLADKTVTELRTIAKNKGIKNTRTMKKEELLSILD